MRIETATILRLRDGLRRSGRAGDSVQSPAFEVLARAGLLDPAAQAAIARIEPLVEAMYLTMAADGSVTADERETVLGALRGLTDCHVPDAALGVLLERFEGALRREGRLERLSVIADSLKGREAEADGAFALCAAVATADERVVDAERTFLVELAGWLGIDRDRAARILGEVRSERAP